MLISSAIRSRTLAVGVGFLLNSTSSVASWSWVARCRFWFFCCWVRVLLRGGLLERPAEDWPLAEAEGEGVCLVEAPLTEPGAVVELGLEDSGAWCIGTIEMGISISVAMVSAVFV